MRSSSSGLETVSLGQEDESGEISVLHAEDDPAFAELTATVLENDSGMLSVTSVSRGQEALAYLREHGDAVDCVVSDYDMPEMDGLELLAAVRETHPDLPFFLFTGKGSEEVASEAISAGVTEYLQKRTGTEQFDMLRNRIENAVEKTHALERLKTQNERLHSLVSNAPVVLFVLDEDGTFRLSEGRALRSLGIEPAEVVGESIFDVYSERPDVVEPARRALDGEAVQTTAEVGGYVFDTWYQPVIVGGDVDRVIGVAVEVTDRVQYRRKLEGLHHLGRDLMRADSVDGVAQRAIDAATDLFEGEAASCWLAVEDELRLRASTVDGGDGWTLDGTDRSPQWRAFEGGEPRLFTPTAGEPVPGPTDVGSMLALPLGDNGVLTISARDSNAFGAVDRETGEVLAGTVEVALERTLSQRELTVRTRAMEKAAVGLTLADPHQEDTPLVYVNEGFEAVTGYDRHEALGRNCRFLQGPDTEQEPVERIRQALANEEQVAVELTNYRADGTPFRNHLEITPIRDENGELLRYLGTQLDVTDQLERDR